MNEDKYYSILLDDKRNIQEKNSNFPGGSITILYEDGKAIACREIYNSEVDYYVP